MEELIINPRVQAALRRAHIYTLKEVICLSGPDLERMTKLSSTDVKHLHRAVATALFNRPAVTALQMWRGECSGQGVRLSLGCPVLDAFLRGGFPVPGVSELVGESAAGKTQICMQLSLTVQYPREYGGLGAGAVYVCTEDAFPNKRLVQMIQAQAKMRKDVPPDVLAKISFGENIYIEHAADVASLYTCITRRLPVLLSRGVVRLIIVDSIAALFRSEFSVHEAVARAQQLRKFGAQLHELSNTYSAPVICVNQVSGNVSGQDHGSGAQSKVIPALGITWAHMQLMRIMLSRGHAEGTAPTGAGTWREAGAPTTRAHARNRDVPQQPDVVRTMELVFAPHLPQSSCRYAVTAHGVVGLE
ncbi:DNA repair protein XRCC3 [Lethenteron reissneri]|uniref:DNA repair protein XRCC3 n=1 Tax=Lethenteron reissneri TaxID=7753 RepID=UPI002AB7A4ED|nr:DNA repair protein XRCC3 [Lethenteron reissneri]